MSVVEKAESISWQTVVEPLQDATLSGWVAWGAVAHLNAVISSSVLRCSHNAAPRARVRGVGHFSSSPSLTNRL